jgi:hypothetical protein
VAGGTTPLARQFRAELARRAELNVIPKQLPPLGSPGQPYTGTDKVTARITLANPLGASFNGSVTPIAFTVSDGVHTFTQSSTLARNLFKFITFSLLLYRARLFAFCARRILRVLEEPKVR